MPFSQGAGVSVFQVNSIIMGPYLKEGILKLVCNIMLEVNKGCSGSLEPSYPSFFSLAGKKLGQLGSRLV